MSGRRAAVALGAATAVLSAAACRAGGDRPGVAFLPEMHRSVPYDAYDRNPALRSGRTLQLPPEGTVPVGWQPFPYGPGPEEAERAGRELANPAAPTPEALARGEKVYRTVCFVCHGAKGEGDGPVIGRFPNPPSLLAERARTLPDGRLYHVITHGQGLMPAHAAQVRPDDRWKVVLYVRALQSPPPAGGAPLPAAAPGGTR